MNKGYIELALSANNQAQPVRNAVIIITDGITGRVVARQTLTDSTDGKSAIFEVYTPDRSLSLIPDVRTLPYAVYNAEISAVGYYSLRVRGIQVFEGQTALLRASMIALPEGQLTGDGTIDVPAHQLYSTPTERRQEYDNRGRILTRVVIPENVTVHLGRPNESARNVTVGFAEYIKNVCCSEIYPTWPVEALKANIYAQISLVLNRIYTEWYRGRGYNFDITNSTAYDQYFVYGRNIDKNISDLVDGLFNTYVRKVGTTNPYYTEYCDGSSVTCPGMKQWGTVTLANNGYSALQILRYYYGSDIELAKAQSVAGVPSSYPGAPLSRGSSGSDVATIQRQLSRIAQNYPSIGNVAADGVFGESTENAVKRFQQIFGLIPDGVVGESTWYKISNIYVAVKKLAELSSEGERYGGDGQYPGTILRRGSRGSNVSSLQYYINVIANGTGFIPSVTIDGIFGSDTENAVRQFQSLYGLSVDGLVGPSTWNTIYDAYKGIIDGAETPGEDEYPGTPLRIGSVGDDVRKMQEYLNTVSTVFPSIPKLTVDGRFGSRTDSAVRVFQQIFGLASDGIIGPMTWEEIVDARKFIKENAYGGSLLRYGSQGNEVRKLQRLLNCASQTYPSIRTLSVDGIFGSATQSAVRELQRISDIAVDGIVGPATWNALLRINLRYPCADESSDNTSGNSSGEDCNCH